MIRALRATGIGLAALIAIGCCAALVGGRGVLTRMEAAVGISPTGGGSGTVAGLSIGGPFTLTDARTGALVTEATYRGRWMLVYFGYTYCPDICPTDLTKMVSALTAIGPAAARITPVFVTIDPARDRPPLLARYVGLFSPRLVGLTGSQAQIDGMVRAYRVYVQKLAAAGPGAPYLMNHSAFMYLMNPEGKLAAMFEPDVTGADLAHALAVDTAAPAT